MGDPFSIVIVCKNEADVIGNTLRNITGLSDDIVVFDNGSDDGTIEIIRQFPVRFHSGNWEGFGITKQKATLLAKHDWVLTLDADEAPDEELISSLKQLQLKNEKEVYSIRRKNFLGDRYLRFGEWGHDSQMRLFNRKHVSWDPAVVHEKLRLPPDAVVKKLTGHVLHRTMKDLDDYARKMVRYALLNAQKYQLQGKKSSWFRIRLSPAFNFLNYYIFKLGFLDGHAGYICAKMTAWYTFLKYSRLRELNKRDRRGDS
jgi:glycosyltransferase involved in cell wall biosynthesis